MSKVIKEWQRLLANVDKAGTTLSHNAETITFSRSVPASENVMV